MANAKGSWFTSFVLLFATIVIGCQPTAQIEERIVPNPADIQAEDRPSIDPGPTSPGGGAPFANMGSTSTAASSGPKRMLAAIVPKGKQAWSYKITGPVDVTQDVFDEFVEFLESTDVSGEVPTWTLPAGWTVKPSAPSQFGSYATILIPTDGPTLELKVNALMNPTTWDSYTVMNINRWRGQLQLPELPQGEILSGGLEKGGFLEVPTKAGTARVINISGTGSGSMSRGPFSSGAADSPLAKTMAAVRPQKNSPQASSGPIQFEVPSGWSEGETGPMRRAFLTLDKDGQQVSVKVSDLNPGATSEVSVLNMWRQETGLEPLEGDQLNQIVQAVPIGDQTGKLVSFTGSNQEGEPMTTTAAMVTAVGRWWFFKLQGDPELAMNEAETFRGFLKSVQFSPAQ